MKNRLLDYCRNKLMASLRHYRSFDVKSQKIFIQNFQNRCFKPCALKSVKDTVPPPISFLSQSHLWKSLFFYQSVLTSKLDLADGLVSAYGSCDFNILIKYITFLCFINKAKPEVVIGKMKRGSKPKGEIFISRFFLKKKCQRRSRQPTKA